MSVEQLTRRSWILAGLQALAATGVDSIKVDRLAKDLKVTRGSFYWHFNDHSELLSAVLDLWQQDFTIALIESVARILGPRERLQAIAREAAKIEILGVDNGRAENAFRQWAAQQSVAAKTMQAVDTARLSYLEAELSRLGFREDHRKLIAKAIYMALLGLYAAREQGDLADELAFYWTVECLLNHSPPSEN